jgi:hypothetical protein
VKVVSTVPLLSWATLDIRAHRYRSGMRRGALTDGRAEDERTRAQHAGLYPKLTIPRLPLVAGESWFHYACVRTRSQGLPPSLGPDTGNWKKEADMIDKWFCVDW